MTKGEIYWAYDRQNHFHPIVFLESIDTVRFKACIISSEPTNGNILMLPEHFCVTDGNNERYDLQYNNSHLVISDSFIKMDFWIRRENVVGKLTSLGIQFVESYFHADPILWAAPIWKLRPPQ